MKCYIIAAFLFVNLLLAPCWLAIFRAYDSPAQTHVDVSVKCTRCGAEAPRSSMVVYRLDGKSDITLCRKCVYEQAESFIKFCPVE